MSKINLNESYLDFFTADFIIDVPDELAEQLLQWERDEGAYERQRYRYKAHFSLDRDDGTEHDILFVSLSACEIYERKVTYEQLHAALSTLPDKQSNRIYAHYFLGMSKASIARAEGVSRNVVCSSIKRGLKNMEQLLKKSVF
ncbi:MAG: sigma-70 family RNA polymerase sigma factor [Clostridiales bacterium]|jgi:RNA polymerase sigma-70 factor (ECF subfamily)|nr:sigma-70 family RNA polymerase sigma factor [Clostridiales bacterium]